MESKSYVLVVTHGNSLNGSFSDGRVKMLAASSEPLTFGQARDFINEGKMPHASTFQSSGAGYFQGLTDEECKLLFKTTFQEGLVKTHLSAKGDPYGGSPVWCLVGKDSTKGLGEIAALADTAGKTVILICCRGERQPPLEVVGKKVILQSRVEEDKSKGQPRQEERPQARQGLRPNKL